MANPIGQRRWAVIGASRGLGLALTREIFNRYPNADVMGVSRSQNWAPDTLATTRWHQADVAKDVDVQRVLGALEAFAPEHVICAVGGGPYGVYFQKEWKDHDWALRVTQLFPMRLAHSMSRWAQQSQLVLIGSSVAEDEADPMASSYAAAKHALLGFAQSFRAELSGLPEQLRARCPLDLRLASPGYMDTSLLPPKALARQHPIWAPERVAILILDWMMDGNAHWHLRLARHPGAG